MKTPTLFSKRQLRNPLFAVILALIAIIAVFTYLRFQNPVYQITHLSPENGQTNIPLTADIIITLNRSFEQEFPLNLTIRPPISGKYHYRPTNNQIFFTPDTYWQPDTNYTIVINSPRIKQSPQFNFTTIILPSAFQALSPTPIPTGFEPQPDQLTPTEEPNPYQPKFQLISTLPHETDVYVLKYVINADHFLILPKTPDSVLATADAYQYIASFGITDPKNQLNISTFVPLIYAPHPADQPATPSATINPEP